MAQLAEHIVPHDKRVRQVASCIQHGRLASLNIANRVRSRVITPQVRRRHIVRPHTSREEIRSPLDFLTQKHALSHESRGITVRVQRVVGIRTHLVIHILMESVNLCAVSSGAERVARTSRLGGWRTKLRLVTEPVTLRVNEVLVALLLNGNRREDTTGDIRRLLLNVCNADVRQNRINMDIS